ncbi:hypothetical protein ACODYM_28885 [Burkholderia gladioli]|uniref:hypothetical protein n=1 Tax=Burkholderia gladioli TaxID=28095 RepID=UPI003B505E50
MKPETKKKLELFTRLDPTFLIEHLKSTSYDAKVVKEMISYAKECAARELARPDTSTPDFDAVKDMRMSEMTPAQKEDSLELWIRSNVGWMGMYHEPHYAFLLKRIDELRAAVADRQTLDSEIHEVLGMFMSIYSIKGWDGDNAYVRAEAILARGNGSHLAGSEKGQDPCPQCEPGSVCRTPTCGRIKLRKPKGPVRESNGAQEGLVRDGYRYRKLRDPKELGNGMVFACVYKHAAGTIPQPVAVAGEALDQAVDAIKG